MKSKPTTTAATVYPTLKKELYKGYEIHTTQNGDGEYFTSLVYLACVLHAATFDKGTKSIEKAKANIDNFSEIILRVEGDECTYDTLAKENSAPDVENMDETDYSNIRDLKVGETTFVGMGIEIEKVK